MKKLQVRILCHLLLLTASNSTRIHFKFVHGLSFNLNIDNISKSWKFYNELINRQVFLELCHSKSCCSFFVTIFWTLLMWLNANVEETSADTFASDRHSKGSRPYESFNSTHFSPLQNRVSDRRIVSKLQFKLRSLFNYPVRSINWQPVNRLNSTHLTLNSINLLL